MGHQRRESLSSLAQKEEDGEEQDIDDIEISLEDEDDRNNHFNQTFKAKQRLTSQESNEFGGTATKSKTRDQEALD